MELEKPELHEPNNCCALCCFIDQYSAKDNIPFFSIDNENEKLIKGRENLRKTSRTFESMLGTICSAAKPLQHLDPQQNRQIIDKT